LFLEVDKMGFMQTKDTVKALRFHGADIEIRAQQDGESVKIDIMKSGACVHRLTIDDAFDSIENSWIADLFAREDRVALSELSRDADAYIGELNINQG